MYNRYNTKEDKCPGGSTNDELLVGDIIISTTTDCNNCCGEISAPLSSNSDPVVGTRLLLSSSSSKKVQGLLCSSSQKVRVLSLIAVVTASLLCIVRASLLWTNASNIAVSDRIIDRSLVMMNGKMIIEQDQGNVSASRQEGVVTPFVNKNEIGSLGGSHECSSVRNKCVKEWIS